MNKCRHAVWVVLSFLITTLIGCGPPPSMNREAKKSSEEPSDQPSKITSSTTGERAVIQTEFVEEFRSTVEECEEELRVVEEKGEAAFESAKTPEDRGRLAQSMQNMTNAILATRLPKLLELIKPHAADRHAIEPLFWVATYGGRTESGQQAAGLLIKHHLTNTKTIETAFAQRRSDMKWVEQMLRAQIAAPELPEEQRPRQMLALAQTLTALVEWRHDDARKLDEAIQFYTELGQKYADQEYRYGITFGELATTSLYEIENLSVGRMAPDIEGEDLDGVHFKLSDYRGKVVMLSFWGSWCGPCLAAVSHERELVKQYDGRPFVLIGVNSDEDKNTVIPIVEKEMITWRSFWSGEKGPFGRLPRQWNVMSWPTVYLIDHTGSIRAKDLEDSTIERLVVEAEKAIQ